MRVQVSTKLVKPNTPLGYSLCLVNLVFDGYTNAAQDEINKRHPKNPPMVGRAARGEGRGQGGGGVGGGFNKAGEG